MRAEIEWLNDALSVKELSTAATYYRVKDRQMTATNGRIVACCPVDLDGEILVPGEELWNILKRLPDEPSAKIQADRLVLRSGKFSGSLQILPPQDWHFPFEIEDVTWEKFPLELLPIFRDLRPFVSDNAVHRWAMGVAVDDGWCYASNNIVLAGAKFAGGKGLQSLVPSWVVDFILSRSEGLTHWATAKKSMAFKWRNGSWMRSSLIDAQFPERAGEMIRESPKGTQTIRPDYRHAVVRISELVDKNGTVSVYADRVEGKTSRSTVTEDATSSVPKDSPFSLWSAENLGLVMSIATHWSPATWPKPTPFNGERVKGFILGRTG